MRFCLAIFGALLLLCAPIRACLWDRDTLEAEARGVPDVIKALSGRFERNPPLFYEMRLRRVSRELQASPQKLELYDDASVACDRLDRHAEALAWMAKKRARLQVLPASRADVREHWYRLHANAGTFRMHRWIHDGADRGKLGEVKAARDSIARAIKLNPNAHFGREKYQLRVMDWVLKPPPAKEAPDGLPDVLGLNHVDNEYRASDAENDRVILKKRGHENAAKALSGIVTLGAAWQSVDVFNALRHVEAWRGDSSVVHLLTLRLRELALSGRASLHPASPSATQIVSLTHDPSLPRMPEPFKGEPQRLEPIYKRLRLEADAWHARRTAWMLERLNAGRHPDTDSTFWAGWDDGGPPPLRAPTRSEAAMAKLAALSPSLGILLLSSIGGAIVVLRRRGRKAAR